MISLNQARQIFSDFFASRGHEIKPSAPLIPHGDNSLMFVNSGMAPLKNLFINASLDLPIKSIASAQKCLRVKGKHNDLAQVGLTNRHHTFFEMLGNFSFGEYFKERAISLAWELVTQVYAVNKKRLYVTIYHSDDEAYQIWSQLIDPSRIFRISSEDNFWSMGESGPCGPCSEIFYSYLEEPVLSIDDFLRLTDSGKIVEIWNLVFMQFSKGGGELNPLAVKCIDTGMGLERIVAVLQGVEDNYETDLFRHLILASQKITNCYGPDSILSHRIIADHLRAAGFLIAEGLTPSNEEHGYVLRRIIRRAATYAYKIGYHSPLLSQLVPALVEVMGFYRELSLNQSVIFEILMQEEVGFARTLERGGSVLEKEIRETKSGIITGEVAFRLYDTYGFPLDLTKDISESRNLRVDEEGFDSCMIKQREGGKREIERDSHNIWRQFYSNPTNFVGYDHPSSKAKIIALVVGQDLVQEINDSQGEIEDECYLLLDQTPFYAESGGQESDYGTISADKNLLQVVGVTKAFNSLFLHKIKLIKGLFKIGDEVRCSIDLDRRQSLRRAHSGAHLFHYCLRALLGTHVSQKGSLISPDKIRFDFNYHQSLSPEQRGKIEEQANEMILSDSTLDNHVMPYAEALAKGALAFFGDKYGDEVRIVKLGESFELCGGTHVARSGEIGLFKIINQSAIASGIRRIEALTGRLALQHYQKIDLLAQQALNELHCGEDMLIEKIKDLKDESVLLGKRLAVANNSLLASRVESIKFEDNLCLAYLLATGSSNKDLMLFSQEYRKSHPNDIGCFASSESGIKSSIFIVVGKNKEGEFPAVMLLKKLTKSIDGSETGGGNSGFAQSVLENNSKFKESIDFLQQSLRGKACAAQT